MRFLRRARNGLALILATLLQFVGAKARLDLRRKRRHLRDAVRAQTIKRLCLGAGTISDPDWIATDYPVLDATQPWDWERVTSPNTFDAIMAEHVWEHLTEAQGLQGARNCHRFLKPGGYFRIAVPDGLHPDPDYIDYVRPGGHGAGADDHKVLFTYLTLSAMLKEAGFQVRLLEYFDEDGGFHFQDWDIADGFIRRSSRYDERNSGTSLAYTSLIVDGIKRET